MSGASTQRLRAAQPRRRAHAHVDEIARADRDRGRLFTARLVPGEIAVILAPDQRAPLGPVTPQDQSQHIFPLPA